MSESVSATSFGPILDNTDADWRSAFSCGGEIEEIARRAQRSRREI